LDPLFASLRNDDRYLGFIVKYPPLPDIILRGLLSRLGQHAGDQAIYWKYGCWFHESRSKCHLIIESTQDDSRTKVTVRAWGRDPEEALRGIPWLTRAHGLAVEPETQFLNFKGFENQRGTHLDADLPLIIPGPSDLTSAGKMVYLSHAWGRTGEAATP